MNKSVMTAIFATGLAAAGWVGWGFIGHSPLALAMTVMIAATYLLGAWELMRYRTATASLTRALDAHQEPPALEAWLEAWTRHYATRFGNASKAREWPCQAPRSHPTW